ncbi:hypothetical protein P9112_012212 [Eukaryota sp. TZLM1-RC]
MIDWQHAFGKGKYRRKTIGFGNYNKKDRLFDDEIYIRELSIVDGGFGCALWDAAILFSRWIYHNSDIFSGQDVLELGAGVGSCGLTCARFANKVYITDYIDSVIDNINYNVQLNSDVLSSDSVDIPPKVRGNHNIKERCFAQKLDWTTPLDSTVPKCDIIIGSELTYSNLFINDLMKTLTLYAHPHSAFYEVLSTDRDGVSNFIDLVEDNGWSCKVNPPPDYCFGEFNTGQREEEYLFYTFRPDDVQCRFPDFK